MTERRFDDPDVAYAQGYQDGRRDFLKQVSRQAQDFQEKQEFINNLLKDPEKLVAYASQKPAFESAMILAVMGMLLAESGPDALKSLSDT